MRLRTLVLTLLLAAGAGAARADEIQLTNGRTLEGKATVLADGRVEVRTSFGTLVLPAGRVARIERSIPLEERVEALRARLAPGDADGLFRVARWAWEQGAATLARRLYEEVLALDPEHQGARLALGFRRHEGRWVDEQEYRAARGEVRFRGEWIAAAERERVLAWETAQRLAAEEEGRRAAWEARLAAERREWLAALEAARQPPPVVLYGGPLLHPKPFFGFHGAGIPRPVPPGAKPPAQGAGRTPGAAPPPRPLAGSRDVRGGRTPPPASAPAPRLRASRPTPR